MNLFLVCPQFSFFQIIFQKKRQKSEICHDENPSRFPTRIWPIFINLVYFESCTNYGKKYGIKKLNFFLVCPQFHFLYFESPQVQIFGHKNMIYGQTKHFFKKLIAYFFLEIFKVWYPTKKNSNMYLTLEIGSDF